MDLTAMKAELSAIVSRGTTVDSYLEAWLRRAVRAIERSHRWQYMRGFATFVTVAGQRYVDLPGTPAGLYIRRVNWVRLLTDDGELRDLQQVDIDQIHQRFEGRPQAYWVATRSRVWFDKTPAEEYDGEWAYELYTTWSSTGTFEPWLFIHGDDLVLAQAVMYAAAHTKNDELKARYDPIRQEAFKLLLDAEEEFQQGNRTEVMQYGSRMLDLYDNADVETP